MPMKFIDDLYEYYKDRLTGDEEDAEAVTMSILDELSRRDVLKLIGEMTDEELLGMFGLYVLESLKAKTGPRRPRRDAAARCAARALTKQNGCPPCHKEQPLCWANDGFVFIWQPCEHDFEDGFSIACLTDSGETQTVFPSRAHR